MPLTVSEAVRALPGGGGGTGPGCCRGVVALAPAPAPPSSVGRRSGASPAAATAVLPANVSSTHPPAPRDRGAPPSWGTPPGVRTAPFSRLSLPVVTWYALHGCVWKALHSLYTAPHPPLLACFPLCFPFSHPITLLVCFNLHPPFLFPLPPLPPQSPSSLPTSPPLFYSVPLYKFPSSRFSFDGLPFRVTLSPTPDAHQ